MSKITQLVQKLWLKKVFFRRLANVTITPSYVHANELFWILISRIQKKKVCENRLDRSAARVENVDVPTATLPYMACVFFRMNVT